MNFKFRVRLRRATGFSLEADESCEAESLGLVGPSGSGKSTLLDAIAGIEPGADVHLGGVDCTPLPLEKREVGYVTQDALLFPHLTVRENLLYSPRAAGLGDVPDALGIASLLDRRPRTLSGGERRRVALARAILSRPRVLLLDEPFGGLDEARRREAMSLLDRVRRSFRIPTILVSHLADEVIGLSDWAIRLEAGRVVARGPSSSLLRASETKVDNYFNGEVVAPGRVRVGSTTLSALLPEGASGRVRLACYAQDLLLATNEPAGLSARNVFRSRIASLEAVGDARLAQLDDPVLRVLLSAEAVGALNLKSGSEVYVILKATSIVYLGRA